LEIHETHLPSLDPNTQAKIQCGIIIYTQLGV
jgi:hypothetical protein